MRGGNLATARRDWLTAHLQYETLGDAYGAFGDFDTEIDGRADPTGVSSPQWTGFFRLEYGLWHGQSLTSLAPVADTLNKLRQRARHLVADAAGTARRPRAARPRGHRERPRVPAHRARRLRQRHHAGEHGRRHHRQPGAARPAAARCSRPGTRGCPRSTPGLSQLQSLLGERTAAERLVGSRLGAARRPPGRRSTRRAGRCCRNSRPSRRSPSRGTPPMTSERQEPSSAESTEPQAAPRSRAVPGRGGGRSCAAWPAASRAAWWPAGPRARPPGTTPRSTPPDPAAVANEAVVTGRLPAVPFHGKYQAGILPEPSRATAVVSFDATADDQVRARRPVPDGDRPGAVPHRGRHAAAGRDRRAAVRLWGARADGGARRADGDVRRGLDAVRRPVRARRPAPART